MQPVEGIAARIVLVGRQRVLLDADLAALHGVQTRVLLQAVRRNFARFPRDFMFPLSDQDVARLRSQSVISKPQGRGGRRYRRQAFTEHGAIMAASVLNSPRAIEVSVYVVRAFVRMRDALATHRELGRRLDQLQSKVGTHDRAIGGILAAIRQLTAPPEPSRRRRIGFV